MNFSDLKGSPNWKEFQILLAVHYELLPSFILVIFFFFFFFQFFIFSTMNSFWYAFVSMKKVLNSRTNFVVKRPLLAIQEYVKYAGNVW